MIFQAWERQYKWGLLCTKLTENQFIRPKPLEKQNVPLYIKKKKNNFKHKNRRITIPLLWHRIYTQKHFKNRKFLKEIFRWMFVTLELETRGVLRPDILHIRELYTSKKRNGHELQWMKDLPELCQLLPCLGTHSGKATHFVTVNSPLHRRAKMLW